MPSTFAMLSIEENLTAAKIIDSLRFYAEKGAVIAPTTVADLIDRVDLTDSDKQQLEQCASLGISVQKKAGKENEARKYQQILNHLASGRRKIHDPRVHAQKVW